MICIDDTDGVWWEVEQLVGRHLGKMLSLIHPRYASATENALILGRLSRYFGGKALQAASPPIGGQSRLAPVIGFFRDQSGSHHPANLDLFTLRLHPRPAEMKVP